MADTQAWGACGVTRAGSSPVIRTIEKQPEPEWSGFLLSQSVYTLLNAKNKDLTSNN